MADYQEDTVSGTKWKRAKQIICDNPIDGMPSVTFFEEEAIRIGTQVISTMSGRLKSTMTDPNETFKLLNPVDGSDTGITVTHGQLYAMMYSVYIDQATKRDAGL